jgi:hypothetical protein
MIFREIRLKAATRCFVFLFVECGRWTECVRPPLPNKTLHVFTRRLSWKSSMASMNYSREQALMKLAYELVWRLAGIAITLTGNPRHEDDLVVLQVYSSVRESGCW